MWQAKLLNRELANGQLKFTVSFSKDENPATAFNEIYTISSVPADEQWLQTITSNRVKELNKLDTLHNDIVVGDVIPEPVVIDEKPVETPPQEVVPEVPQVDNSPEPVVQ